MGYAIKKINRRIDEWRARVYLDLPACIIYLIRRKHKVNINHISGILVISNLFVVLMVKSCGNPHEDPGVECREVWSTC